MDLDRRKGPGPAARNKIPRVQLFSISRERSQTVICNNVCPWIRKQFCLIMFSDNLREAISLQHLTFPERILNALMLMCLCEGERVSFLFLIHRYNLDIWLFFDAFVCV